MSAKRAVARTTLAAWPALALRHLVPPCVTQPRLPTPFLHADSPSPRQTLHPASPARLCRRALAGRVCPGGHITVVVTADPADANRLQDELPFFAPGLRVAVFGLGKPRLRQLFAAPGPDLRAPGHAVAHPPKRWTWCCCRHHGADAPGPPGFLAAHTFISSKSRSSTPRSCVSSCCWLGTPM